MSEAELIVRLFVGLVGLVIGICILLREGHTKREYRTMIDNDSWATTQDAIYASEQDRELDPPLFWRTEIDPRVPDDFMREVPASRRRVAADVVGLVAVACILFLAAAMFLGSQH